MLGWFCLRVGILAWPHAERMLGWLEGLNNPHHCAASLKELNEAVGGSYVVDEPAQLISSNPSFFHEYDLVIGAQVLVVLLCTAVKAFSD